ncbi:3-carboxy-cis,cis-muconate cycloisomerase [Marmoricola sp. URHA0025 HA25]
MHFDLLARIGGDPAMERVFSEERTVASWLRVEAALGRALASAGVVDIEVGERIADACVMESIDLTRLWKESAVVGYPILPLVRMICENLPEADAAHVHYGATTQDIMDSGMALQIGEALVHIDDLLGSLGDALARLVALHRESTMAARTHVMQAVPTTFGAKLAVFLDTLARQRGRLRTVTDDVRVVSLFGAGGTSAALGADAGAVRAALADELGLQDCGVPWHVARDRFVAAGHAAAEIASTCTRLGREIIDMSRLEIGEVAEEDGMYRGASSTMPQKANPISSEMAVGFGAWAATAAAGLYRAMEAGHERAAGEWHVEWAAVPATFTATAGALLSARDAIAGLRVFPERMLANLETDGGRLMAEAYMMALAPHLGRGPAHELVYAAVRHSRQEDVPLRDAVRDVVTAEVWRDVEPVLPWPQGYLGQASAICDEALKVWAASGEPTHPPGHQASQGPPHGNTGPADAAPPLTTPLDKE